MGDTLIDQLFYWVINIVLIYLIIISTVGATMLFISGLKDILKSNNKNN